MSHSSFRVAPVLALAVALTGCTVYVNSGARTRAAKPTATSNSTSTAKPTTTTTTTGQTTGGTTKPASNVPMITGRNAFGNGNVGAFRGQAYVIPDTTTKMPDFSKLVPFAQLLTDSFIVQPQEFSGGFPGVLMQDEWFAIQYTGQFEIPKDGTYTFVLNSDDGAILYIDNQKVLDNDGVHTAKVTNANKDLKAGRHQLRLDYFQGKKGTVALSLAMGTASADQAPRALVGIR